MSWILITGLIRDPANALLQAEHVTRLKAEGLVSSCVFSTWQGEFARYPEVHDAFRKIGAVLIESEQPTLRFPGHVLHQSLALLEGLDHIPDGERVLRIRPDIAPIRHSFDAVLKGDWLTQDLGSGLSPTVYSERVWAHSGFALWPFYLNDILYYGRKEDVRILADVDLKDDWRYSEISPEQFFHLRSFIAVNPVLRQYARIQRGMHSPEQNHQLLNILWQSDFWYNLLYQTAQELVANYHVGYTPPETVSSEAYLADFGNYSITDIFAPEAPLKQIEPHPHHFKGNSFHSLGWALALLQGRFRRDAAYERMQDCITNKASVTDTERSAEALSRDLAEAFPHYTSKLRRPEDGFHAAYPSKARFAPLEVSDTTRMLQEEINHMRRLLEQKG